MGRHSAILNSSLLAAPIVFGLLVVAVSAFPTAVGLALAATLSFCSVVLLGIAKLTKFRQGNSRLPGFRGVRERRALYYSSYVCLFCAISAWVSLALMGTF